MHNRETSVISKWHKELNRARLTIYKRIKINRLLFELDLLDFKYEHEFYEATIEDLIKAYCALLDIHLRTEKYLKDHK